jgi:hypothetical protein
MGMQRHSGGGMAVRTISCIPGVTGDWRYPGGGVAASTKGFWPKRIAGAANANVTVAERDSDMGDGAVFHDNRVEVRRLPP